MRIILATRDPDGFVKQLAYASLAVILGLLLALCLLVGIGAALIAIASHVQAQPQAQPQNHEQHHAQYENWWNNAGAGCCNDQDCGPLDPARVRENGDHIEVLVNDDRGDQWCPIEFKHLINQDKGKRPSPDWTMDHACIIGQNFSVTACERLKCFMEKGKF